MLPWLLCKVWHKSVTFLYRCLQKTLTMLKNHKLTKTWQDQGPHVLFTDKERGYFLSLPATAVKRNAKHISNLMPVPGKTTRSGSANTLVLSLLCSCLVICHDWQRFWGKKNKQPTHLKQDLQKCWRVSQDWRTSTGIRMMIKWTESNQTKPQTKMPSNKGGFLLNSFFCLTSFFDPSWGALGGVWPAGQGRFSFPSTLP